VTDSEGKKETFRRAAPPKEEQEASAAEGEPVVVRRAVQPAAKDLLIGKWEQGEGDKKGTLEFTRDGKLKVSIQSISIDGTYKLLDEKTLEVTIDFMGKKESHKSPFKVTRDTLELTDPNDPTKIERFKRVGPPPGTTDRTEADRKRFRFV